MVLFYQFLTSRSDPICHLCFFIALSLRTEVFTDHLRYPRRNIFQEEEEKIDDDGPTQEKDNDHSFSRASPFLTGFYTFFLQQVDL